MNLLTALTASSIGKKWIVAITGLAMVGFLVGHLVGNLQVFVGWQSINRYGNFLHSVNELLWLARIGLIVAVVLHIVFTIKLALENRAARPESYGRQRVVQARISSRTMIWSGSYILCFIVVHLLHFTFQKIHPQYQQWVDEIGRPDIYRMMIVGFSDPLMSGFYAIGMILLCSHLSHGIHSMFQTLGLRTKHAAAFLTHGGRIFATLLAIGYVSIPAAVLVGGLGRKYVHDREAGEAKPIPLTVKEAQP